MTTSSSTSGGASGGGCIGCIFSGDGPVDGPVRSMAGGETFIASTFMRYASRDDGREGICVPCFGDVSGMYSYALRSP